MSRYVLALVAVLALTLPAVAFAAAEHITGATDQGLRVTFGYAGKKVTDFRVRVRCTSRRASTFKFPSPIPVNRKGKFSVHQAGPSLDGTIKDHSAKGTIILPGCNASANEVKFTAHSE